MAPDVGNPTSGAMLGKTAETLFYTDFSVFLQFRSLQVFVLRRARLVLTFLPIIFGYSLLYLIKLSDDIQKIGDFQSSHLYGNSLCLDLAHAA